MYPEGSRRAFLARLAGWQLTFLALSFPAYSRRPTEFSADENAKKEVKAEEVYEPGGAVTAPKLTHYVEPEFSPRSKEAYVEGIVKISTVVDTDGLATASRVTSGLNAEEDRTALEALQKWKFKPGTKNGQPVKVRVTVEVEFHLL